MDRESRICLVGDSFVQGIGDPEHRGWVGRVLEVSRVNYNPARRHPGLGYLSPLEFERLHTAAPSAA
jgi:hypothetical protein